MQITIAITLPYHQFKEWSKENVKTRTARSRTREGKRHAEACFGLRSIRINSSFRKFSNQLKPVSIATVCKLGSNGALVCFTCVASNSILKRQTFALNMTNEEKKK
ncbi:hypothetical protein T01_8594, partial [Trichinella spiralis]